MWQLVQRGSWLPGFGLLMLLALCTPALAVDTPLLAGRDFTRALDEPLTLRADDIELRGLLTLISEKHRLATLLDRRVDPHQSLAWPISSDPLLDTLTERLAPLDCSVRVIGSTIVIAPSDRLSDLRTLIALREEELRHKDRWPAAAKVSLFNRRAFAWEQAAEPRELIQQLARNGGLSLSGGEELPHDLWTAGKMGDVNVFEALSLVLFQYDRTFAWGDQPLSLKIVPMPERVEIERRVRLPRSNVEELLTRVASLEPRPETSVEGRELLVRGTIEQYEAVTELVNPRPSPRKTTPKGPPLSKRRFSLTAKQVTVQDALKVIDAQGIPVIYDEKALKAAGGDLEKRIDLSLENATFDELMQAICRPAQIDYTVKGLEVTLSPEE